MSRAEVMPEAFDEARFWALIEAARETAADDEAIPELLIDRLTSLTEQEIRACDRVLWRLMRKSYRNELWAAAYIINGGCSDDGFDYFRGWLIAQGQAVFEAALANPASLEASIPMDGGWDAELEEMLSVAYVAYQRKTGSELPSGEPAEAWELLGPDWTEASAMVQYESLYQKAEARYEDA